MKKIISRKIAQITAAVSLILIPSSTFASTTLCTLAQQAVGYFNMAIEVIIGLAVVVFVFNVYRYFFMDRENNKERGMYLLWSIIGFAVIICFWGLVNVVANTFNLDKSAPSFFGNLVGGTTSSSPCGSSGTPMGSQGSQNSNGGVNTNDPFYTTNQSSLPPFQ
jgi:heme/copper-type cytochrome/quinol oxidase subunit 4